jgi:tripartite-type tricarboxylate transporter receptor subunit TctC
LFAPAGTPKEVLDTIYKATAEALKSPSVKAAFEKQHFNIVPNASVDDARKWAAAEHDNWTKITQEVKIELAE